MKMEEENRREAAIEAKAAALQSNPKSTRVTQDHINKFKELRRRRLQINAKSKVHNKKKENVSRAAKEHGKDPNPKYLRDEDANLFEESSVSITKGNFEDDSSLQQEKPAPKKRQKLHWGLDTKERWERKANM